MAFMAFDKIPKQKPKITNKSPMAISKIPNQTNKSKA
jgi:hypothetical protein